VKWWDIKLPDDSKAWREYQESARKASEELLQAAAEIEAIRTGRPLDQVKQERDQREREFLPTIGPPLQHLLALREYLSTPRRKITGEEAREQVRRHLASARKHMENRDEPK
jgi:hypothetical protein